MTKFAGNGRYVRWYDQVPGLKLAIDLLQHLPPNIQVMLARSISHSIGREGWKYKHDGQLKQIGRDKILGLMKSKKKLRWHDQQPDLHQAFNDLYVIENAQCQETSIRILVSIATLEKKGLEWLSSTQCQQFIDEIFACDAAALMEKAKSLKLLTSVSEEALNKPRHSYSKGRKEVAVNNGNRASENEAQVSKVVSSHGNKGSIDELKIAPTREISEDGDRLMPSDMMPISLKNLAYGPIHLPKETPELSANDASTR